MYDYKTKRTHKLAPMREKRDELAVRLLNFNDLIQITMGTDNKMYAIGGFGSQSNTCLNSVERYNPKLDIW